MANVSFLEKFSRYVPSTMEAQTTLKEVYDYSLRIDKEKRMIEATIAFDSIVSKKLLYSIENEIAKAYELTSMRIFPRYQSGLFTRDYMHEVIVEAYRIGMVSRGFFADYSLYFYGENNIKISIGMPPGGANLLYRAGTDKVIEKIIENEFGLKYNIVIETMGSIDVSYEAFAEQNRKKLASEMAEAETEKKATPVTRAEARKRR